MDTNKISQIPIPPIASSFPNSNPQVVFDRIVAEATMSSNDGKKPSNSKPQIRTIADLNRRPPPSNDGEGDVPQEYYTGGEKSGMLVQDPTKDAKNVDAIFEHALQMGAVPGPSQAEASSSRSFTGTGRLLSGETVTSATPQQPERVLHTITFWINGFTVNDGPLRRFDDPENLPFMESIMKSECPKELEASDGSTAVNVKLIRKNENYSKPVTAQVAFQGAGRSLGSASSEENPVSNSASTTAVDTEPISSPVLSVDESLPSTSIQLRLADGTRTVARFNLHHTVGHIRAFIDASRPGSARNYRLRTSDFPPKQLTDVATTIEQAGLANSVLIQSL